ncbi:hypothetical protein B0I00_1870 [Novosphingobium kunmingense]|uniref:Uncharacterized protein n=1 Tax=Novosphingobium kunmingense TaxID=1211806 RepID=A0A2N0HKZ7_9SPHN|nr:hypothetical protein [Novosphingobium kunmingense]PKB19631.1 hypothetical protein B0I00_1870 [Novosphingobium kunmingense]
MARRRRARTSGNEFAKPLLGLVLLALIWGAYELGVINLFAEKIVGISKPKVETNAGAIYRREVAKKAGQ